MTLNTKSSYFRELIITDLTVGLATGRVEANISGNDGDSDRVWQLTVSNSTGYYARAYGKSRTDAIEALAAVMIDKAEVRGLI